jgi:penicillin-binding protein 1C
MIISTGKKFSSISLKTLTIYFLDALITGTLICIFIFRLFPITIPPISMCDSLVVCDRNGGQLRNVFNDPWGRTVLADLKDISPEYLKVVVAVEDNRFRNHCGLDPYAVIRALWLNAHSSRIKSGASTITQQLARLLWSQGRKRSFLTKAQEAIDAVRIEATLSKDSILYQYLNRVSFGNNCRGIETASHFYLGKSASRLTTADAAFLVSIPQNPTLNNPHSAGFERVNKKYRNICTRLLQAGVVDSSEYERILALQPDLTVTQNKEHAIHFVNNVLQSVPQDSVASITTTIDMPLQLECEAIINRWLDVCAPYHVTNAASVIVDNKSGEVLAWVGSRDFLDNEHSGQVDGVKSLRQPGSSLKPFLYAFSFDHGWNAATLIPDIPSQFTTAGGFFEPSNYDKKFHGPVRVRQALACSYNIPAIYTCQQFSPEVFLGVLHKCGFSSLIKSATEYGPGLALGNGEVTLLDLTCAYTIFPRRGTYVKPVYIKQFTDRKGLVHFNSLQNQAVTGPFTDESLRLIEDILSDNDARSPAFGLNSALQLPFPCAVKTGTSKDFKDNWCVGWTSRFTVGVWAGNFDASPMHNVSGVSGAAPIFHEEMLMLDKLYTHSNLDTSYNHDFAKVRICAISGALSTEYCPTTMLERFLYGKEPKDRCKFHTKNGYFLPNEYKDWALSQGITLDGTLVQKSPNNPKQIISPANGEIFSIDPEVPPDEQQIKCSFTPLNSDTIMIIEIDSAQISLRYPFVYYLQLSPGQHSIKVLNNNITDNKTLGVVKFKVIGNFVRNNE